MTGWCPYDGEVCRHDGYCKDCPNKRDKDANNRDKDELDEIITKAIREELEAVSGSLDDDKFLMLSMFGAAVRFNILGKLKE